MEELFQNCFSNQWPQAASQIVVKYHYFSCPKRKVGASKRHSINSYNVEINSGSLGKTIFMPAIDPRYANKRLMTIKGMPFPWGVCPPSHTESGELTCGLRCNPQTLTQASDQMFVPQWQMMLEREASISKIFFSSPPRKVKIQSPSRFRKRGPVWTRTAGGPKTKKMLSHVFVEKKRSRTNFNWRRKKSSYNKF